MTDVDERMVEADVELTELGHLVRIDVPGGCSASLSSHAHHSSATIFLHRLTRKDVEAIHTAFGEFLIETS